MAQEPQDLEVPLDPLDLQVSLVTKEPEESQASPDLRALLVFVDSPAQLDPLDPRATKVAQASPAQQDL